jgi:hypothetical protein
VVFARKRCFTASLASFSLGLGMLLPMLLVLAPSPLTLGGLPPTNQSLAFWIAAVTLIPA